MERIINHQKNVYSLSEFIPAAQKQVNEEELYVAAVSNRLQKIRGNSVLSTFQAMVKDHIHHRASHRWSTGLEDACNVVLDELELRKIISTKDKQKIKAESFAAAQLDKHKEVLWDSIGGKGDPTIAIAPREKALKSAEKALRDFDIGRRNEPPPSPSVAVKSNGSSARGEILFKPISNSNGKVSVLIPTALAKSARSVSLVDMDGKIIEIGRFKSYGDTGERAKFEFGKSGGQYPKQISVVVSLQNGEKISLLIRDSSKRFTTTS